MAKASPLTIPVVAGSEIKDLQNCLLGRMGLKKQDVPVRIGLVVAAVDGDDCWDADHGYIAG
jgi:hypothetical protein